MEANSKFTNCRATCFTRSVTPEEVKKKHILFLLCCSSGFLEGGGWTFLIAPSGKCLDEYLVPSGCCHVSSEEVGLDEENSTYSYLHQTSESHPKSGSPPSDCYCLSPRFILYAHIKPQFARHTQKLFFRIIYHRPHSLEG